MYQDTFPENARIIYGDFILLVVKKIRSKRLVHQQSLRQMHYRPLRQVQYRSLCRVRVLPLKQGQVQGLVMHLTQRPMMR